jgi:hypothetical protein
MQVSARGGSRPARVCEIRIELTKMRSYDQGRPRDRVADRELSLLGTRCGNEAMIMQQPERYAVEVPCAVDSALQDLVVRQLQGELAARGLLLPAKTLWQAEADIIQQGEALITHLIAGIVGTSMDSETTVCLRFESEESRAHIQAALAFGATVADVLALDVPDGGSAAKRAKQMCGIFNLGIGLLDSLCDEDSTVGAVLLDFLNGDGNELVQCAREPRRRGWIRSVLPGEYGGDASVRFVADLVEVFFQELHAIYPGDTNINLRHYVGTQLTAALKSERDSVCWSPNELDRERLLRTSRLTTVLPLQIIESLVCGSKSMNDTSTGTLLGEALWRIDDLVDLCQDVRSGALNSILVAALEDAPSDHKEGVYRPLAALEKLLRSRATEQAAAEAVEYLAAGLRLNLNKVGASHAAGNPVTRLLAFVQRYAGVPAAPAS